MENGKKVCNELKAVRKQIADANGIEYAPKECTHKGDCAGSCPACEAEVKYLERELSLRKALGKAVVIAGLGLAVASCSSNGGEKLEGEVVEASYCSEESLEGDVLMDDTTYQEAEVTVVDSAAQSSETPKDSIK
ncbi:MAG: hypothetical protein MJZ74_01475 [Muribaculaceae bacterium]|nr:hypothetical protein [Muribaculaceae bacterium]